MFFEILKFWGDHGSCGTAAKTHVLGCVRELLRIKIDMDERHTALKTTTLQHIPFRYCCGTAVFVFYVSNSITAVVPKILTWYMVHNFLYFVMGSIYGLRMNVEAAAYEEYFTTAFVRSFHTSSGLAYKSQVSVLQT